MTDRDYRLDKAKGLLIFLVVCGHFLERISGWEMGYSRGLLTAVYSFHMPAFVFLAGITAKSNRLLDRILVFVVLLISAQPIYYWWVGLFGKAPDVEFDTPYWITWFLLAMVWWLLLLPLVEKFPVQMLIVSFACGLLGGVIPAIGYELSLGRSMTFFPFFVIGKLYGMQLLKWGATLSIWQKLGVAVVAIIPMSAFFVQNVDHRWFYGARGFEFFDAAIPYGVGVRVLICASAMLTIVAVMAWSDHLPGFFIPAGQHSLAIFLLHGLIVRALNEPLNSLLDRTSGSVTIVVSLLLAGLVTWLLSWGRFDQAIRWYSTKLASLIAHALTV